VTPSGRRSTAAPILVAVAAAIFAIVYVWLDFNALYALRTGQNTGLYLQSLVNFVHGVGTFDQPDGRPHLAVHDQWLALALAPAIAMWPNAKTLIVAQVALLAAAAPLLYLFARTLKISAPNAACIAIAYLLAPSTQGWAYHPFVPEDALPLVAFGFAIALAQRRFWLALAACELLLGIKEDEALFLAWIGAFVAWRVDRRIGCAVVALAIVNLVAYYGLDRAFGYAPEHPAYGIADATVPQQLAFLAEILAPLAFAPLLLGWRVLLVLPFVAELFLAQDRTYPLYQAGSYYTIPLVTLATLGAAVAIARRPALARWCLACAALMALFFNTSVLHFGRHPFSRDPLYGVALRIAGSALPEDFPCDDAGAWTVAAADPNARLACSGTANASVLDCAPEPARDPRPAWRDEPLGSHAAWTELRAGPCYSRPMRSKTK
jgi:uncharacterized membrane protein